MRRAARGRLALLGIVLACASTGALSAQAGREGHEAGDHDMDGWLELFDGETLGGWRVLGGGAEYRVEDGTIVGVARPGIPNTFLATGRSFGDFVLQLEFLVDPGLNSGVQVRSASRREDGRDVVFGYQVEIDPTERGWTAGIYDESRRGWLAPMEGRVEVQRAFRPGEWNRLRVECQGERIRTWLNGVPAAYLLDDETAEGFVALQVHSVSEELAGSTVRWRGVRLREGPVPAETEGGAAVDEDFPVVINRLANDLDARERELGWRLAWDGVATTGWRGAHREQFPERGWTIEDGVLTVAEAGGEESAHGGDIVTVDEYSAFELQLEFKLSEGANSGIKYYVTEGYDPGGGSAIGLELQLLDDQRHPDARLGRDGNRTLASLYDLVPAHKEPRFVRAPGEWGHARIVARADGHVEHWLEHRKVLEYERFSDSFAALVAISKYRDWEGFGRWPQGHLLLQDHGDRVSFRSIKVRRLDAGVPAAAATRTPGNRP